MKNHLRVKTFGFLCNPQSGKLSLVAETNQNIKPLEPAEITRELIVRCSKGNARAQRELYDQYAKAMYNVSLRLMRTREAAEDMLQEAFADAFNKLGTFRFDSGFGSWLKRIVINNCINEIKRRKADIEYFEDMQLFEKEEEIENREYEDRLTVSNIKNAMQYLPEGSRIIFSLYLLEGYDHLEIAQILNISESNSKSQYMRAKNRIKEILSQNQYETR